MKTIILDIETQADESMIDLLPEPKIDSRLKDEEKIETAINEARAKQVSEMALSPLWGKIACVGLYNLEDDTFEFISGDEKSILEKIMPLFMKYRVVTYNGKGFDIPFIFKRAFKYNMGKMDLLKLLTNKYKSELHVDIMADFCEFGKFEKLDTLARVYLGTKKVDFDVTTIKDLVKTPKGLKQLKEYCKQDVMITKDLYNKFYKGE